ncbi:hypothetical protein VNO80_03902 [Phaseolus coccineus]|uniref:Uncharacterized protein n=1 Tax=Phaseolus coccineus TaxID=3886 RepID=A0AAN9NU11_PHACN
MKVFSLAYGNCRESQCLLSLVSSEEGRCVQVMPVLDCTNAATVADWYQLWLQKPQHTAGRLGIPCNCLKRKTIGIYGYEKEMLCSSVIILVLIKGVEYACKLEIGIDQEKEIADMEYVENIREGCVIF